MTEPRSLLATVTSLRADLDASFPRRGARPHALSAVAPSRVAHLRAHLEQSLATLRSSLASLESLLPPPEDVSPRNPNLDKFLSLLSQSAATQHSLLSLSATSPSKRAGTGGRERDRDEARRRAAYPTLHPEEVAKAGLVVLPILERIAKDLGLVCFRDDEHEHGDSDSAAAGGALDETAQGAPEVVTLSLGGKVMVVDFKLHRERRLGPATPETAESVHGIKVAYVWKGEQYFDERSARKLSALFQSDDNERRDKEGMWSSVRNVLQELHEADERTAADDGKVDWFAQLDHLVATVEQEFPPIASLDDSLAVSLPALLPDPASLYPLILLSATPSALLHPAASAFLSVTDRTSSVPTDPTRLQQFLDLRGTYAARFDFPRASVEPTPPFPIHPSAAVGVPAEAARTIREWCRARILSSTSARGIPITKSTGKRIHEALDGAKASKPTTNGIVKAEGDAVPERPRETNDSKGGRSLAELLLERESLSDSSHTIPLEPRLPSKSSDVSVPPSFRFQLVVDSKDPEAFSLTTMWLTAPDPGEIRTSDTPGMGPEGSMKKLRRGIEILCEQLRINDLVSSVINSNTRDSEDEALRDDGSTKRKRRKVERDVDEMTLDELLGDQRPSIRLSFPTPHLPATRASPISMSISSDPDSGGYAFTVQTKVDDVRKRLEDAQERGREVLTRTQDLGIFLRWVVKRLVDGP
ncbi:hypothetical protein JCM11491_000269 [Sporobolomyces phaffii]